MLYNMPGTFQPHAVSEFSLPRVGAGPPHRLKPCLIHVEKGGTDVSFADKTLTCRDCGADFIFTAGEQEFYASRGLMNEPSRCQACRGEHHRRRSQGSYERAPRQMYPAVCANCGAQTEVPFEPRTGRPVYCNECFTKMRRSR